MALVFIARISILPLSCLSDLLVVVGLLTTLSIYCYQELETSCMAVAVRSIGVPSIIRFTFQEGFQVVQKVRMLDFLSC